MKYFATFDADGNRITTYVEGLHTTIPADAIAITEAEQNLYCTGNYIRGTDGKPALKPPYVPTAEELKQQQLVDLDAEYQPQFADLAQSLGLSTLDGNQTVIDGIKADYAALKAEYQAKREAIENA